ncbi:MAG: mRNA turnover and ribosome assembly protein [Lichina confinis]|nr:MAG: mRNA turnover and ribosome assembly protein [Lichina confinis]
MPKSKRAKVVTLSKTERKGKELTLRLFANVRECLEKHQHCFVFSVENMRNTYLKDVRQEFSDSRLFFGKTKVMAKALGANAEDEHQLNTSELAKYVTGNVGLFFTSRAPAEIIEFFESYVRSDYARAGTTSPRSFTIPAGTVYSRAGEVPEDEDVPLAHSLEPTLRALDVPTRLTKGVVTLDQAHRVCEEGDVLDSKQTRLLKLFGVQTAEFRVMLVAYWSAATSKVTEIGAMEE